MNLSEALDADLIGFDGQGNVTLPREAFEAVHAAARRFLALTETGRQVRYCLEHQALIGALPYLCNVANWVIDGGGSPTDCRVVPKLLADYLSDPHPQPPEDLRI